MLQRDWRWILQHVLPKGFRRVRDYGLLRGHEKKLLQAIQFMFMLTGQLTLDNKDNGFHASELKRIYYKSEY